MSAQKNSHCLACQIIPEIRLPCPCAPDEDYRIETAENIGAKGQRTISPNFGDPKINECRV